MGTISVTLPADGTTADVADVNTPITTIVNAINGGLDNTNIAASAGISTSKLADDAGITTAKIADNNVTTAKIANDSVTDDKLDYPRWYQEIGRATASSSVTSISTGTFLARKYLKIIGIILPDASVTSGKLQFNGDSANNYQFRVSTNGGADAAGINSGIITDSGSSGAYPTFFEYELVNISSAEKLVTGQILDRGLAGASAPNRREVIGKWTNTSAQITSMVLVVTGCNMTAGSELIILGHD